MTQIKPVSQKLFDLYLNRVEQYGLASSQIKEGSNVIWPRMLIRGLYVELALKTYRGVFGDTRHEHDLELLADRCVTDGLQLTSGDHEEVIGQLQRPYYEHKGWSAKHLCRYPSENENLIAWNLPQHDKTCDLVERIVDQAKSKYTSATA